MGFRTKAWICTPGDCRGATMRTNVHTQRQFGTARERVPRIGALPESWSRDGGCRISGCHRRDGSVGLDGTLGNNFAGVWWSSAGDIACPARVGGVRRGQRLYLGTNRSGRGGSLHRCAWPGGLCGSSDGAAAGWCCQSPISLDDAWTAGDFHRLSDRRDQRQILVSLLHSGTRWRATGMDGRGTGWQARFKSKGQDMVDQRDVRRAGGCRCPGRCRTSDGAAPHQRGKHRRSPDHPAANPARSTWAICRGDANALGPIYRAISPGVGPGAGPHRGDQ